MKLKLDLSSLIVNPHRLCSAASAQTFNCCFQIKVIDLFELGSVGDYRHVERLNFNLRFDLSGGFFVFFQCLSFISNHIFG